MHPHQHILMAEAAPGARRARAALHVIASYLPGIILALCFAACAAQQPVFVTSVFPAVVPVTGASTQVQVLLRSVTPAGGAATVAFTSNGTTVQLPLSCTTATACTVSLPSSISAGVAQLGNVALGVFVPPTLTVPSLSSLTTTGFVLVQAALLPSSPPFPVPAPMVLLQCTTSPPLPGTTWQRNNILNADGSVTLASLATVLLAANGSATASSRYETTTPASVIGVNASVLQFYTQPVPDDCGMLSLWVSYNGGAHMHAIASFPVQKLRPLTIVSLYPYNISASPWVATHNGARIAAASLLQGAVDATSYFEQSWRLPALPTGTLIDAQFFNASIFALNASLVLCAGTQYLATALTVSAAYPNVSILIMSTVLQVLPARPNLAFATGRMYEAMYIAGLVAGATTRTGRLGFIMSLDHPTVYAFVNAFMLGAQAALNSGLAKPGVVAMRLFAHIIGSFSNDYAERMAAIDLLTRTDAQVDILCSVTDNPSPHRECHARSCYSVGFNGDLRQTLGDAVLISTRYLLQNIYSVFVTRMLNGRPIGPDTYSSGMGRGVDITTTLSPIVSLAAQRAAQSLAVAMRSADDLAEKVFCTASVLVDNNATVRLNAGGSGPACLSSSDIGSMRWMLAGVTLFGLFSPPPAPGPLVPVAWVLSSSLQAALLLLPVLTLIAVLLSSMLVLWFRHDEVVRFSSPEFLLVINAGAAAMSGLIIWSVLQPVPSDAACTGNLWLSGLSFVLLFGALFAKTYRMDRLFNNAQLRRLRITSLHVLRLLMVVIGAEIVVLVVLTLVFPRVASVVTVYGNTSDGSINSITTFSVCAAAASAGGVDASTVLNVAHLLLLLWGAILGFRTRNLPQGFNESRYIGFAIYNVTLCEALAFLLAAPSGTDPRTQYIVLTLRFGVPALATMLLLYVPKVMALALQAQPSPTLRSADESTDDSAPGSMILGASPTAKQAGLIMTLCGGCLSVLTACVRWVDPEPELKVAPAKRASLTGKQGSGHYTADEEMSVLPGCSSDASILSGRMHGLSSIQFGSSDNRSQSHVRLRPLRTGADGASDDFSGGMRSSHSVSQDMSASSSAIHGSLVIAARPEVAAEVVVTAGGVAAHDDVLASAAAEAVRPVALDLTAAESRDPPSRRQIVVSPPLDSVPEVAEHSEV